VIETIMKYSRHDPLQWIQGELAALVERGLHRELRTHDGPQQVRLNFAGRELINFGSNDYLGLAADRRLCEAASRAAEAEGCGAGASPLLAGYALAHWRLERHLAEFEGTEAAILFSSGYAANVGTIAALAGRHDAIYSDRKNHASMIDGCRLSRADVHIYPHGDPGALEALLRTGGSYRRRLIVTESVFSMDGDLAPLAELADLAERFDCMLLVDEAHATGVFGKLGRGLAEALDVEDRVHVRVGTLSKALGCAGGFVCGRKSLVEWLVNRARPYVFSTGAPPPVCAAALAALEIVRQEPLRRETLSRRAAALREALRQQGWQMLGSASQIIPLVVGAAEKATELAGRLHDSGLLVPAIRPPSVPEGQSLLRISLSCAHTPEMIARLTAALAAAAGRNGRD
jgi:8-amino-7-oxononanoate synthase